MRKEAIAVLAAALVLAGSGAGYYLGASNPLTLTTTTTSISTLSLVTTQTSSRTSIQSTTITSTTTMLGLEMFASVFPDAIRSGENVSLSTELFNPLSSNFTITVVPWSTDEAPCEASYPVVAYHIYQGRYNYSGLATASSLLLYNGSLPILCFVGFDSTYNFGPHGAYAHESDNFGQGNVKVNYTNALSGYWVRNQTATQSGHLYFFQQFQPGAYTVLFYDQWGQEELEYFTVS